VTTSLSSGPRTGAASPRHRRSARALAVLGATAAAAAAWVVAGPVAGTDLEVSMNGRTQPVGLASVVGTSLAVGLLGWALLALLESRTRRAAALWTAVALAVAVLSLAGPLTSATNAATGFVLAGLHLLVAGVLVPTLRRSSPTE
jgi:Family of unknown function (DUF6069)